MSSSLHTGASASRVDSPDNGLWTMARLDTSFAEFLRLARDAWGHSPNTLQQYKCCFSRLRSFLHTRVPDDVSPLGNALTDLDGWIAWLRQQGVSPITINTYWRSLRPFYKELARVEGLDNPFQGYRPPPIPAQIPKAWSVADCQRILTATRNYPWPSDFIRVRSVAIVGTFLYTGVRRGELLRLQFLDVNLSEGTLRVIRGKGKGGGKDRLAYLAPELVAILKEYLTWRHRFGLTAPEFFLGRWGTPLSLTTLRRLQAAVRDASGVKFSWHSLRHSFVTLLLKKNIPIHVVRDLCGHRDIATTMNYVRVWDEEKRDAMQRVSLN